MQPWGGDAWRYNAANQANAQAQYARQLMFGGLSRPTHFNQYMHQQQQHPRWISTGPRPPSPPRPPRLIRLPTTPSLQTQSPPPPPRPPPRPPTSQLPFSSPPPPPPSSISSSLASPPPPSSSSSSLAPPPPPHPFSSSTGTSFSPPSPLPHSHETSMEQRLQKDINQQQQQQQQQQRVPQDQHTEGNRYMRKKVETKLEARSPVSKQARPKTPFNAQKRNVEDMTQDEPVSRKRSRQSEERSEDLTAKRAFGHTNKEVADLREQLASLRAEHTRIEKKSEEQACTLGHHLRLLKAKTERINVLEQNQDKQQQKWHNAGKMELALEAKGDELNQQQKLVKEKNYQMQSLHKNIRILNRTLADCSDRESEVRKQMTKLEDAHKDEETSGALALSALSERYAHLEEDLATELALREMADEKLGTLFGLLPDTEDSEQGEDLFAQLVRIVSAPPIEPIVTVTNHDGFEELQEVLSATNTKLEVAVAKVGAAKKEKAGADKAMKERKAAAMMAQRKSAASEKEARLNEESLRTKVQELEERNTAHEVSLDEAHNSAEVDAAAFDKERQVLQERVQMLTGLMARIVGQQRWFCEAFDRDMASKMSSMQERIDNVHITTRRLVRHTADANFNMSVRISQLEAYKERAHGRFNRRLQIQSKNYNAMVTVKKEQIQQVVDEFTCVLCLCNRVDIWVAPCNHACLCESCARQNLPESTFQKFGNSAAPIVEGDQYHINRNINIKEETLEKDRDGGGANIADRRRSTPSSGVDALATATRRTRSTRSTPEVEPAEFQVRERDPSAHGVHSEPVDLAMKCPICRTDIQKAHKIFL